MEASNIPVTGLRQPSHSLTEIDKIGRMRLKWPRNQFSNRW